jgi:hypothetical protein
MPNWPSKTMKTALEKAFIDKFHGQHPELLMLWNH